MFPRTFITSLGASLLAVCASASIAADQQGWYLGAGIGAAKNTASDGRTSLSLTITSERTNATGYKLYGGYQFNDNLAAELEYADFGKYSFNYRDDQERDSGRNSEMGYQTLKISGWGISAVGMAPLSEELVLFGKVGAFSKMVKVGPEYVQSSIGATPRANTSFSKARWVPLLGVGAAYRFTSAMSVRAEYEYLGKKIVGDASAKLANHLLSISANYRF